MKFEFDKEGEQGFSNVDIEFRHEKEARLNLFQPGNSFVTFKYPTHVLPVTGSVQSASGVEEIRAVTMRGIGIIDVLGQTSFGRILAARLLKVLFNDAFSQSLRNKEKLQEKANFRAAQDFDFSLPRVSRERLAAMIGHQLVDLLADRLTQVIGLGRREAANRLGDLH